MHALLNCCALMHPHTGAGRQGEMEAKSGIAALISNSSLCEIALATLQAHCYTVMAQYHCDCQGGSKSGNEQDAAFRTWLETNPARPAERAVQATRAAAGAAAAAAADRAARGPGPGRL